MTQTFTQDVLIDGVQDTEQLRVQGHSTQTDPLQTWENSAGDPLAQVTGDGRLQIGDIGMTTPDALIEAHREDASMPQRGIHSLGRISGALSDAVSWVVGELELLGTGGVSGLQTALRARLTHSNSGDSTGADLRAGDFETINDGGSSGDPVGSAIGLRAAVTNTEDAYLDEAAGIDVIVMQEPGGSGEIATAYGVRVADVDGATDNYALYTGQGFAHFGDTVEVQRPTAVPGTPDTDIVRVYPKSDGKLYAKNWSGTEYDLTASGSSGSVTSVGLVMPSEFSVSGSPVTSSGDNTVAKANQSANNIFAGPTAGGAAAPAFRSLVAADIPNLDAAKITSGTLPIANGGTGASSAAAARTNLGLGSIAILADTAIGVRTLVERTALGSDAASISISSIDQNYKTLLLLLELRSKRSSGFDNLRLRFAGDTASNYRYSNETVWSASNDKQSSGSASSFLCNQYSMPGDNASAGYFSLLEVWIARYSTSSAIKSITVHGIADIGGSVANIIRVHAVGSWFNTSAAVTSIEIASSNGANIASGSAYALYGVH